jgi:hypothetical protein
MSNRMDSAAWIKLFYEDVTFPASLIGEANGADPIRTYEYFYSTSSPRPAADRTAAKPRSGSLRK